MASSKSDGTSVKGGQYRDETDMYYRSGSNTWRGRNSGVVVKANSKASASTLERLKRDSAKYSSMRESTLNHYSGYDKTAKMRRIVGKVDGRERIALARLKMQQNKAVRNGIIA